MLIRCFILILALTANAAHAQTGPHPFSVHDMLAMDRLSDAQVSPDGTQVAFTVRVTDLEANKGRSDVWMAAVDGTKVTRLTTSEANDSSARWGANGVLYFLSTRSGSSQIWRLNTSGGEAMPVTALPLDVSSFTYLPQTKSFLLVMEVFPGLGIQGTVEKDAADAKRVTTGKTYDELLFRHWDSWEDGKRNHLFMLVDAPGAQPVDLMPKLDADVPTAPFGGLEEVTVSPDGGTVVYTAKVLDGSEVAWSTDYDLYAVPADGSREPRCLTEANQAWDTEPVFTPDGRSLWYLAMDRAGFEADRYHYEIMDWATGATRRLDIVFPTTELDRPLDLSPHGLKFSADGRSAWFIAGCLGQTSVFHLDVKSGKLTRVVDKGHVTDLCLLRKGLLIGSQNLKSPTELYTLGFDGRNLKPITGFNGARLARTQMGEPEQFTFKGWNDETVFAYIVKPYDWSPEAAAAGRKWPVTFLVHGGPQGSFGNDFHYRWNPQAYVGAGFATLAVDFHGSTGYGQAFTDAISGSLGRPSARRPGKGPGRGDGPLPVDGRIARGRGRRQLRRLHDQLDGRPAVRRQVQGLRLARRQSGRAHGLLRHRRAVVPRMGARRHALGRRRRLRQAQPGRPREELACAHPGGARRAGLPRGRHAGSQHVHGAAAPGRAGAAAVLPRREPLGAQAAELDPVA